MPRDRHDAEDQLLLKRACNTACGQSLSIIYNKYRKSVCDFLYKTGADGLTEDICQTVFMQILEGKCNYDGSSKVKSYLFGVARNIRNQITISHKTTNLCHEQKKLAAGDLLFHRNIQPCPVETLDTFEKAEITRKRAGKLPCKARQAIELVYLKGIPAKKAAKIAQCDFNTFRTRLRYGLMNLREQESFSDKTQ